MNKALCTAIGSVHKAFLQKKSRTHTVYGFLGPAGLEPTTSRTSSGRSSQLSYEPIAFQPVYITTYF